LSPARVSQIRAAELPSGPDFGDPSPA
jgi:hypothetical protein